MDAATTTYALFFAAIAAGVVSFRHSTGLGDGLPSAMRWPLRCTLGLCVFLGIWGELAYVLWQLGVPLKIGSITNGRIREAWWLGPAAFVFAMISYGLLRESTSGKRPWPFSRTVGGVVLVGIGGVAVLYGLSLMHVGGPSAVPGGLR